MDDLDYAKCQKSRQKGHDGNYGIVNKKKTKLEIVVFFILKTKGEGARKRAVSGIFVILERERELILSRFEAVQTVGFRRSKK